MPVRFIHLNLLKRWNEGTSVGLAAVVSNKDHLGPEAALKHNPLALVSGGDHLSPRQLTDLAQLQADFADVFSFTIINNEYPKIYVTLQ